MSPFVRHYLQMLAAMGVGMLVLEPVRMMAASALGWTEVFEQTEPMALAMAAEMSIGMAVWMRFRRHGWTPVAEMCLAMFVPFLVLFIPLWAGLIGGTAVMVIGHVLMLPAMAIVMLRRPEEYGGRRSTPPGRSLSAQSTDG